MRANLLDDRRRRIIGVEYSRKILGTLPDNLIQYLPLWERVGETAVLDQSDEGNDAVANTVTFGAPGIGDGNTAGKFNSSSGFVNVHSAGLNTDFNGAEGTCLIWGIVSALGVWSDSTLRTMEVLRVDNNNRLFIAKSNTNDQIQYVRIGNATIEQVNLSNVTPTNYFVVAMTWSEAADEMKAYFMDDVNGFAQVGATQTGLGAFAGNLSSTLSNIGATTQSGSGVWDGSIAHPALWNTPLTLAQLQNLAIVD